MITIPAKILIGSDNMNQKRKAIIITGYGTSQIHNLQLIYGHIRDDIACTFPDYNVKIAFTSLYIIHSLKESGIHIPTVSEELTNLKSANYEEVILLSTHMLPCNEYEHIKENLLPFYNSFSRLVITNPLLYDKKNVNRIVKELIHEYSNIDSYTAVILMGHGSSHPNNSIYHKVNEIFQVTNSNIFIATLKSSHTINDIIGILHKLKIKKVILAPFMMVSGTHVKKDMIGDSPNSWKSILEKECFSVEYNQKGLGEYKFMHEILVRELHALENSK